MVRDRVGICVKLDCICRCYSCEHRNKCDWLMDCSALDWKRIDNARDYYLRASTKLDRIIANSIERIPPKEFAGGLLCRREEGLLRALTFSQGDILETLLVQKYLRYEPDLSVSDIRNTDKTTEFCNLVVFQSSLDYHRRRIENRDLLIYTTPEGLEYLDELADNPVDCMKKIFNHMANIEKRPREFNLEQTIMPAWSKRMIEPIRWASLNSVPLEICGIRHDRNVKRILDHMEELGKAVQEGTKVTIDKKHCYDLSHELYNSLLLVCRVVYTESKPVRNLVEFRGTSSSSENLEIRKSLDIENWDAVVIEAYMRILAENYLFDSKMPEITYWQMDVQEKSFWGSATLLAFIEKNREVFRDRVAKEMALKEELRNQLIDRGVRVLKHGLSTPLGDVDLLCTRNSKCFVIETKDYEPMYEDWYISSKTFQKRRQKLGRHLKIFQSKAQWLFSIIERTVVKRPINFLFITRFTEIPVCVEITTSELDSIFGPSKLADRRETLPTLELENDNIKIEVMGREIPNYLPTSEFMLDRHFGYES